MLLLLLLLLLSSIWLVEPLLFSESQCNDETDTLDLKTSNLRYP